MLLHQDPNISASTPTIVTDARWEKVFGGSCIPASLTPCDMDSYLRAHVAAAMPLLALCCITYRRGTGLTWAEASTHAKVSSNVQSSIYCSRVTSTQLQNNHSTSVRNHGLPLMQAQAEGFAIVKKLGHSIPRASLNWMSGTPHVLNTFIVWLASRVLPASFQELLASGAAETAANINEMNAAAPGMARALLKIRPAV